jgi:hypothetical protein
MKFVYQNGHVWTDFAGASTKTRRLESVGFVQTQRRKELRVAANGAALRYIKPPPGFQEPEAMDTSETTTSESSTTSSDTGVNLNTMSPSELKEYVFAGYVSHLEEVVSSLNEQLSRADSKIFQLEMYNIQLKNALEEVADVLDVQADLASRSGSPKEHTSDQFILDLVQSIEDPEENISVKLESNNNEESI